MKIKNDYVVIVGNIGTVYSGNNHKTAVSEFNMWVGVSKNTGGRASGESVTMHFNGELEKEYIGTIEQQENTGIY